MAQSIERKLLSSQTTGMPKDITVDNAWNTVHTTASSPVVAEQVVAVGYNSLAEPVTLSVRVKDGSSTLGFPDVTVDPKSSAPLLSGLHLGNDITIDVKANVSPREAPSENTVYITDLDTTTVVLYNPDNAAALATLGIDCEAFGQHPSQPYFFYINSTTFYVYSLLTQKVIGSVTNASIDGTPSAASAHDRRTILCSSDGTTAYFWGQVFDVSDLTSPSFILARAITSLNGFDVDPDLNIMAVHEGTTTYFYNSAGAQLASATGGASAGAIIFHRAHGYVYSTIADGSGAMLRAQYSSAGALGNYASVSNTTYAGQWLYYPVDSRLYFLQGPTGGGSVRYIDSAGTVSGILGYLSNAYSAIYAPFIGPTYLHFYCSGNEGLVDPAVPSTVPKLSTSWMTVSVSGTPRPTVWVPCSSDSSAGTFLVFSSSGWWRGYNLETKTARYAEAQLTGSTDVTAYYINPANDSQIIVGDDSGRIYLINAYTGTVHSSALLESSTVSCQGLYINAAGTNVMSFWENGDIHSTPISANAFGTDTELTVAGPASQNCTGFYDLTTDKWYCWTYADSIIDVYSVGGNSWTTITLYNDGNSYTPYVIGGGGRQTFCNDWIYFDETDRKVVWGAQVAQNRIIVQDLDNLASSYYTSGGAPHGGVAYFTFHRLGTESASSGIAAGVLDYANSPVYTEPWPPTSSWSDPTYSHTDSTSQQCFTIAKVFGRYYMVGRSSTSIRMYAVHSFPSGNFPSTPYGSPAITAWSSGTLRPKVAGYINQIS